MATPTLVQSVVFDSNRGDVNNVCGAAKLNFPNLTLANNLLVVQVACPYSATRTITVTDDKGNTWTKILQTDDSTNLITIATFAAYGAAAGTRLVTVTFNTTLTSVTFAISEWYNVATSAAANGTVGATAVAGPTIATGSFTPGNNDASGGNLIMQYAQLWDVEMGNLTPGGVTGITAGASFTLQGTNRRIGKAHQYFVQATSAAINPTVTISQATNNNAITHAVAFKAAAAGTAPDSSIRIVHSQHVFIPNAGTYTENMPATGNLLSLSSAISFAQTAVSALSDNKGNTWTLLATTSNGPQSAYAAAATTAPDLTLTFTLTGTAGYTYNLHDISGAATLPFDQFTENSGTQSAAGADITAAPLITPGATNGLVFAFTNDFTGPPSSMVAAAQILDSVYHAGMTDASTFDNGDGFAHYYNPDTTQISFDWHMANVSATGWTALAVAFKGVTSINAATKPFSPAPRAYPMPPWFPSLVKPVVLSTVITAAASAIQDIALRFRLSVLAFSDVGLRMRLSARAFKDAALRFRLSALAFKDVGLRASLTARAFRDVQLRLGLAVRAYKDVGLRTSITARAFKDTGLRFFLGVRAFKDVALRARLIAAAFKDVGLRFRLSANAVKDIGLRFSMAVRGFKDIALRARISARSFADIVLRFRLSVLAYKDVALRFRLSAQAFKDAQLRFRLSARAFKDVALRFSLVVPGGSFKDIGLRFRLSARAFQDAALRFRLSALAFKDVAIRFRLSAQTFKDIALRFRLSARAFQDAGLRFRLSALAYKDIAARFRLSVQTLKDAALRFNLVVRAFKDVGLRARISARGFQDVALRFRLAIQGQAFKDIGLRARISARAFKDAQVRFGLGVAAFKDVALRFRLVVATAAFKDIALRTRLSARTFKDIATRFGLGVRAFKDVGLRARISAQVFKDAALRFRLSARSYRDVAIRFALIPWGLFVGSVGAADKALGTVGIRDLALGMVGARDLALGSVGSKDRLAP